MSQAWVGGGVARRSSAALRAAEGLAFAATPVFAVMALMTGVLGGHTAEMHASPLSGMTTMYLLMSAFHASPWLKLIGHGRQEIRA